MLAEFNVTYFRNFEKTHLKLDNFNNYEFNENAIYNNVIKTSIIYGVNGSGKTNLGLAILDIFSNLIDKTTSPVNELMQNFTLQSFSKPFLNLNFNSNAQFYYKFKFDSDYVEYTYEKKSKNEIIEESLSINGKEVIHYNHLNSKGFVKLTGTESLITTLSNTNISYVKFVNNNSSLPDCAENNLFKKFMSFVSKMLYSTSLDVNIYFGRGNGHYNVSQEIIKKNKLQDFQEFLKEAGIVYNLYSKEMNNQQYIMCKFPNNNDIELSSIASKGTITLMMLYFWLMQLEDISFIFLDEFDAFYHFELSWFVVKKILEKKVQAIFTTHNTTLISNDLLRPDCYMIIENDSIKSISNSTNKELRQAHNIEKMYRAGAFGS